MAHSPNSHNSSNTLSSRQGIRVQIGNLYDHHGQSKNCMSASKENIDYEQGIRADVEIFKIMVSVVSHGLPRHLYFFLKITPFVICKLETSITLLP